MWSYCSTCISTSNRDFIRFRLGLTSSGEELVQDEEIDAALSVYGTKFDAAAAVARSLGAQWARRADMTMGKLKINHSQKSQAWNDLADQVVAEGAEVDAPAPWAAAHSHARKEAIEDDTDRVEPFFERGMQDPAGAYPGVSAERRTGE